MTHLLLYEECLSAGPNSGLSNELGQELLAEGGAMLAALAADFAALPDVELTVAVHSVLRQHVQLPQRCVVALHETDPAQLLSESSARLDATIIIAPECAGILAARCRAVERGGGKLLGPASDWAALAGDKHRLAERLLAGGVRAPRGELWESAECGVRSAEWGQRKTECRMQNAEWEYEISGMEHARNEPFRHSTFNILHSAFPSSLQPPASSLPPLPPTPNAQSPIPNLFVPFPLVFKPNDGAGSCGVRMIDSLENLPRGAELAALFQQAPAWRLEEFIPGTAASVAFLCGPNGNVPLLPCLQRIERGADGALTYRGSSAPLPDDLAERAIRLGAAALAALPPTVGYVGIDLVLANGSNGSLDTVIEVNPRLTTSYLGLRALAAENLAAAWLRIAAGERANIRFHPGQVELNSRGQIRVGVARGAAPPR